MYMSIHKISLVVSLLFLVSTLNAGHTPVNPDKYPFPSVTTDKQGRKINNDGGIILNQELKVTHVYHSPFSGKNKNYGVPATKEHLKAWDTDVRPDGKGLPSGSMDVATGAEVYARECASCHGDFGEGVDRFPVLSGGVGTLNLHPNSGGDPGPLKTIGSYMPYIAPIYWYIQTAMPLAAPKSLSNDEVYGIIGYLLQLNEIQVNGEDIDDETVIDKKFLLSVHLPNEKGFEYNNLRVPDTNNKRCMSNCIDKKKMKVVHIITNATQVEPEFGEERYFYGEVKEEGSSNPKGKPVYAKSCGGCHDSGLIGSPKPGDTHAWDKIKEQGVNTVYEHAIKGFNAMPPKGGDIGLSDEDVKEAVDYMMNSQ